MATLDTALYHIRNMPLLGSAAYLGGVKLLCGVMDKREALAIPSPVIVAYNAVQVVINLYVAYFIAMATGGWVFGMGLKDTPTVRYGVWLHYLCKYLDFVDTLIIILRKKSNQLSFLHLWHHSTIAIVWGWVVYTWPAENSSAVYAYGAWINSCIHVLMYSYYACTAMNLSPPSYLKKSVTAAQLTQFASCIVHAVLALFLDVTPIQYNCVQVVYHIGMLKLFLPLLLGSNKSTAKKDL